MSWLKDFPSTGALCVTVIVLLLATFIACVLGWQPPDGWFPTLVAVLGVEGARFGVKRWTWNPEHPNNGNDAAVPPQNGHPEIGNE